jgi:hypothetical protein
MKPVDLSTGLPCGTETRDNVPVLVGWLATHADGTQARLGLDRAKANHYAATHHATLEAMFVWRDLPTHPAAPIR